MLEGIRGGHIRRLAGAIASRLGGCVGGADRPASARAAGTAIASPRVPLARLIAGGAVGVSLLLGAPAALAVG